MIGLTLITVSSLLAAAVAAFGTERARWELRYKGRHRVATTTRVSELLGRYEALAVGIMSRSGRR